MARARGFTLIELMIVIAIIAIIAAITIPNLLRSRMSANEAAASGTLRTISTAEIAFQVAAFADADGDGLGDYGTLAQLADPDGLGVTPPFVDATVGSGVKLGYVFTVIPVAGNTTTAPSYTCTGIPSQLGKTGYRQYFVDETGVIRFTSDGSAPTASSPPID